MRVRRLAEGPPEMRRIHLDLYAGRQAGRDEPRRWSRKAGGWRSSLEGVEATPRTMAMPALSPAELIGRQLSDRERDPVFRESMAVAQVMAQSVL